MVAEADAPTWEASFQEFHARFARFFFRAEVRQRRCERAFGGRRFASLDRRSGCAGFLPRCVQQQKVRCQVSARPAQSTIRKRLYRV